MKTPICDFARTYAEKQTLRLHMPGHKGQGILGVETRDITEIDGADVLYQAGGIIRQSEEHAASLFGAAKTLYSTEGSSLCIRAMLYLTALLARSRGQRPRIAAARNAHKVFVTAAALLNIDVAWLYPEEQSTLLSCRITPTAVDRFLSDAGKKPVAVYITSPDYLGNIADIAGIAAVCRRHGVLLLVDNAHGAYLRFLPQDHHPLALGADLCCDSAHKTLSVLTGGAYLHIGKGAPSLFAEQAETALSLFASTSPSYLILQSLDAANASLSGDYPAKLAQRAEQVFNLKKTLRRHGYMLCGEEPLKITLLTKAYGYSGTDFAAVLREHGAECEFADPDFVVLMPSADTAVQELERLENMLLSVPQRDPITVFPPAAVRLRQRIAPQDALLLPSAELPVSECAGRVLAVPTVACPPAVPIAVCGEELTEDAIRCFVYYGITTCRVV